MVVMRTQPTCTDRANTDDYEQEKRSTLIYFMSHVLTSRKRRICALTHTMFALHTQCTHWATGAPTTADSRSIFVRHVAYPAWPTAIGTGTVHTHEITQDPKDVPHIRKKKCLVFFHIQ
mgnify:CR=1 FL=1